VWTHPIVHVRERTRQLRTDQNSSLYRPLAAQEPFVTRGAVHRVSDLLSQRRVEQRQRDGQAAV
jgi:hypothetical protein